ncbi:MAG: hypothetical protein Q8N21_03460 [bacterium]|nr:hypothetical protein [bacterium]
MRNNNSEQFKGEAIRSKRKDKQKERRSQERNNFRADSEIQEIKEPERKTEENGLKKEIKHDNNKSPEKQKRGYGILISNAHKAEGILNYINELTEEDIKTEELKNKAAEAQDIVNQIKESHKEDEQKELLRRLNEVYDTILNGLSKTIENKKFTDKDAENIVKIVGGENIFEREEVGDLIDGVIKDYNEGGLKNQEVFNVTSELRKKMVEQGYTESQRDEAVEQLARKLNWEIGEDGRIIKAAEAVKTEQESQKVEDLITDKAAEMGSEKKISHQEAQLRRAEMADKEIDAEMYEREELTEELKDRYLALWGERSKILGESGTDKVGRFRDVERKIGEIEKQFAGLGIKIDLFKWIGESEEAPRTVEEEKKEEIREEAAVKPEIKEISLKVIDNFSKEFNINKEDLEQIENFNSLSEGQQLLILENLKQLTLGRIQEESAIKHKKNIAETKFLGRIWQGISKKYQIAKLEKENAEEITQGGMKAHGIVLRQLANGLKEFGPEVEIKDGKLEIQFASELGPEHKEQLDEFNRIANGFSRMPYEWSLKTASRKEQAAYNRTEEQYEEAKINIINIKIKNAENEEVFLSMNDIEAKIKLNQFLNTHPKVEKQLQKIKDKKVWLRVWANVATERGIYAGAGFITRTATMSLVGLAGAPLAAATVGGWMARRRGEETLKDREKSARKGAEDKNKETKDYVDAKYIYESIDFLINKLKESDDTDKQEEMIRSLRFHLNDAQDKIEDGTINFGDKDNRLYNQYELIKKLSDARVYIEQQNYFEDIELIMESKIKYSEDIKVIEKFLEKQEKEISKAQKKYLRDQMIRGAIFSAGFATAGYAIRHFAGEWLGWDKQTKGMSGVKSQKTDLKETLARLHKEELEQLQKPRFIETVEEMEQAAKEVPAAGKIADAKLDLAAIHKDEGVEHAIRRQLEAKPENYGYKGDMNDKQAIHKWSGGEAHRTAIKAGYVNPETGEEIRVGAKGIGRAAYVLEKDAQGKTQVHEYFKGEEGNFKSQEVRELAENFKGAKFEGADKEFYEYEHKGGIREGGREALEAASGEPASPKLQPASPWLQRGERGEPVRHIDLSEAVEADHAMPAGDEAIAKLETEYGITEEIMEKLKINPRDGLSADEGDKLLHLMNHKNNLEQAAESIKMVEGANVSYDDAYEYFYQFKNVSGNPGRMEGIVEILKHHDYKSGLSKIFGVAVTEKNFEVKGGVYRIKDFKPGFDYVVKIDGGEMKFGVDGPLGQWNWGARGRTWRAYIDADLTNENLEKSKSEVENMLKIFEKRR